MGQFCFFKWFISYKYYLRIYLFFKKIHYLFTSKVKKKIEYFTNDFFFLIKIQLKHVFALKKHKI